MVALSVLLSVALLFWTWGLFSIVPRFPHFPGPGRGTFWAHWAGNSALVKQPLTMFTLTLFLLSVYLFVLFITNRDTRRHGLLPERTALGAAFILIVGMVMVIDDLIDLAVGTYRIDKWEDTPVGVPHYWLIVPETEVLVYGDPEARYWAQIGDQWVFLPDGDTLRIGGRNYRLWGVDALQKEQLCTSDDRAWIRCGKNARNSLLELMNSVPPSEIDCFHPDQARYPGTISCRMGHMDAGEWMVRHGHAFATRTGVHRYGDAMRAAQYQKKGAWGTIFLYPWRWKALRCELLFGMCMADYLSD